MSQGDNQGAVFEFGVYTLDPGREQLRKYETTIRLQPQPFKLLLLLLRCSGQVVTREEIQQEIWGSDTHVDFEVGLNQCIRRIRAVLSDDAAVPQYIETVPRKGYRFIAPVTVEAPTPPTKPADAHGHKVIPTSAPKRTQTRTVLGFLPVLVIAAVAAGHFWKAKTPQKKPAISHRMMIAVLPLQNLTGDPQQEYLSDGVTDELTTHLSMFSPAFLGVIARTSSMKYKRVAKGIDQISRELGVDYVLEGSVRRVGDRVRIGVDLVQSSDQTHLWSDSYDGGVDGESLLDFQEQVAAKVAQSLSVVLPANNHRGTSTSNPAAYEAYLRGRYEWSKRSEQGFRSAIDYFQQSIALDPKYSEPYAGLADCYNLLLEYFNEGSTLSMSSRAKDAALQAVKLDPSLAEGHASLAFNLWRYEWNFVRAEAEFKKAIVSNPNYAAAHHWYGLFLTSRGRFPEARTQVAQAQALDPLSLIIMTNSGWVDYYARDYDSAIAKYRSVLAIDPGSLSPIIKSAWAYEQKQMWPDAEMARIRFFQVTGHPSVGKALQAAYQRAGYPGVLKEMLHQAQQPDRMQYYGNYEIARLSAQTGDADHAIAALKKAQADRSAWMVYVKVEPDFDSLRSDPRFQEIVAEVERAPRP